MNREIKFRIWDETYKRFFTKQLYNDRESDNFFKNIPIGRLKHPQQYTGLKDKNGKEIYEGDVLEFSDRWEWYRSKYWVDMQFAKNGDELQKLKDKLAAEPMERREVKMPDCYEEFSKADLNSYWEVIGNIYENPELINDEDEPKN